MSEFLSFINPPKKPSHHRDYRISVRCDQTRQQFELTLKTDLTVGGELLRAQFHEALSNIINKLNLGVFDEQVQNGSVG